MPEDAPQSSPSVNRLRIVGRWLVLLAAGVYGAAFFGFCVYGMVYEQWVEQLAKEHFAAMVGLPSAALAALLLVTLLEMNAGRVELKAPGFELKGAGGPILMWVICFL